MPMRGGVHQKREGKWRRVKRCKEKGESRAIYTSALEGCHGSARLPQRGRKTTGKKKKKTEKTAARS